MPFGFGFNKAKVLASAEKNVKAGKLQQAIADYEKITKEDAKDLTVLNTIGDLYARLGKTEQATSYYKRVGDAFASNGFTVKAIAMYKKITKLDSSSIECLTRLAEQSVKHEKLGNVICTLPGETDDTILVTAHFDKVKDGLGVVDNWSGASLLPSLLYAVDGQPRKHTFVFIGFTDEEEGMVGSQFYASHLTKEQISKLRAVINMDTLALGPPEVWASHADPELLQDLVAVSKSIHVALVGMNVDNVGSTDSEAFVKYKVPRMTIHSLTAETFSVLHSNKDQMSAVKPNDYYDSYRLISVFLAYLDMKLPSTGTAPAVSIPAAH